MGISLPLWGEAAGGLRGRRGVLEGPEVGPSVVGAFFPALMPGVLARHGMIRPKVTLQPGRSQWWLNSSVPLESVSDSVRPGALT